MAGNRKTDQQIINMEQKRDIMWRMHLVYFLMALLGLLVFGKVAFLQFVQGDHWRDQARKTTMQYQRIEATRGDVFADDGRLLATSIPVYEIRMDLSSHVTSDELFYSELDALARDLAQLFGDRSAARYRADLVRARRNGERYYLVKRNVSHEQLQKARSFPLFRRGQFGGGFIVREQTRRVMPYQSLAARTIGYEREGIYVGLEGAYRAYLEGVDGKRLMQRIAGGNWMPVSDQDEILPMNGMDIITTINVQIQDITEKALRKQLMRYRADFGTAVVMEVSTGKIRAISNLSLNESANGYEESYNYAVGYSTEPGSTFKLPAMMAALEDFRINIDDSVDTGSGQIAYADRIMRDALPGGHGVISVRKAFGVSSNVGISQVIHSLYGRKPQQFIDQLRRMRLHQPLGLEIAGEGVPHIRSMGDPGWSQVSLPWMAIGYEVSLTPLQTLAFYNAVANNGRMMKPLFVSEIRQSGRSIKRLQPVVLERSIASGATIREAQALLMEVVEHGTARNIHSTAYAIAGKSGTAQVAQADGGYFGPDGIQYKASFVGYFPADNPAYSCIVFIHHPRGPHYTGSQVAAPVFRQIADKMFAARLFAPSDGQLEHRTASMPVFRNAWLDDIRYIYRELNASLQDTAASPWGYSLAAEDTMVMGERVFMENLVPEVVGMGLRDAIYLLENAGLRVRFAGRGKVTHQSMRPGTRIKEGEVIYIELST